MTSPRDLVKRAADHGLLLSPEGSGVRVESVTSAPVPSSLRSELVANKARVLEFLTWQNEADCLLLETTRSIGECYPSGCPLDTEAWKRQDATLHDAYWSGDLALLRRTLAERERFARAAFLEYRERNELNP